jgi:hypothetical protein
MPPRHCPKGETQIHRPGSGSRELLWVSELKTQTRNRAPAVESRLKQPEPLISARSAGLKMEKQKPGVLR